jgi:hypothetical protein
LNLEWGPLLNYEESTIPTIVSDVKYHIFYTEDLMTNLESSCILNIGKGLATTSLQKSIGLKTGKEYKINVVAVVTSGKHKGYIYPYKSFVTRILGNNLEESSESHIMFVLIFLLVATILGLIICAISLPRPDKSIVKCLYYISMG